MTDAELDAAVNAKLKEEGYTTQEPSTSSPPAIRHARPPAPLIDSTTLGDTTDNAPSSNEPSASGAEVDTHAALDRAEAELAAEKKAKEDQEKKQVLTNDQALTAGAGALVGAGAQYTGIAKKFLNRDPTLFAPDPNKIETVKDIADEVALRQGRVSKFDEVIADLKRNPQSMTQDQIDRLISGGEGSTLGTTGRQRTGTFGDESQRMARHLAETEKLIKASHPNLPDPIVQAGQLVTLPSGLKVSPSAALSHAEDQARQQTEQNVEELRRLRESEQTKADLAEANRNKELSLAKSRGYRSGLGRLTQGAVGGADTALTGADIYNKWKKGQPIDWQDWSRLAGGLGMTFGGKKVGALGALANIPYFIKHQNEIAQGMTMGDVADPRAAVGMSGSELAQPALPGTREDYVSPLNQYR
jgi:hypothetical protein